ncbi:MAG: dihydrodipicolinate synthase family protein [Candidatus Solibacter sp.]
MPHDHGIIAAAITPRDLKGALDPGAAFELIDYLCKAKVHGIALFTAVGEYPAFSLEERSRLLYLAVKRSRVPIYACAGSIGLDDSLQLAREARRGGAAGVLLPPPHFFPYLQPELCEFFLQFSRQLGEGIDVYLANTPDFTSELLPETACHLLASGRFAGIVDPVAGNGALHGAPVALLSGDDAGFPAARSAGAHGALSAAACAVPELVVALDAALLAGNLPEVERLHGLLREFLAWVAQFPFPVAVKVSTGLRGVKLGVQRVLLSAERQRLLEAFCEWFKGWLPSWQKTL